jgi:hypothetical protein
MCKSFADGIEEIRVHATSKLMNHSKNLTAIQNELKKQPAYNNNLVIQNMVDELDPWMLQKSWAEARKQMDQLILRPKIQQEIASGASCREKQNTLPDEEPSMDTSGAACGVKRKRLGDNSDEDSMDGMGASGASCGKKRKGNGASPDEKRKDLNPPRLHGATVEQPPPKQPGKKHLFAVSQPGKKRLFAVSILARSLMLSLLLVPDISLFSNLLCPFTSAFMIAHDDTYSQCNNYFDGAVTVDGTILGDLVEPGT